jgi:hypothetical protein
MGLFDFGKKKKAGAAPQPAALAGLEREIAAREQQIAELSLGRARSSTEPAVGHAIAGQFVPPPAPPPILRSQSSLLRQSQIHQIRAVVGDGHSDADLLLLLGKHGGDTTDVISEILDEVTFGGRIDFGARRSDRRSGSCRRALFPSGPRRDPRRGPALDVLL